jgi:hypothetical protein
LGVTICNKVRAAVALGQYIEQLAGVACRWKNHKLEGDRGRGGCGEEEEAGRERVSCEERRHGSLP